MPLSCFRHNTTNVCHILPHRNIFSEYDWLPFFGLVTGLFEERLGLPPEMRLLILTGFMGAFTTFSTYMFESTNLIKIRPMGYDRSEYWRPEYTGIRLHCRRAGTGQIDCFLISSNHLIRRTRHDPTGKSYKTQNLHWRGK